MTFRCKHVKSFDNSLRYITSGGKVSYRCKQCHANNRVLSAGRCTDDLSSYARGSMKLLRRQMETGQHEWRGDAVDIVRRFVGLR
jgi:hypothetical protein